MLVGLGRGRNGRGDASAPGATWRSGGGRSRAKGLSTVEYALLAIGVIALIAGALVLLEGGVLGLLDQASSRMRAAAS